VIRAQAGGGDRARRAHGRLGRRVHHRRAGPRARRARRPRRGPLRRAAGHRVGNRRRRPPLAHTRPGPSRRSIPSPRERHPPGDDLPCVLLLQRGPGSPPPITPMGLAAFRLLASAASGCWGSPSPID
jgi:hypothetical protein